MNKSFMKIFASLFVLLLVVSFGVLSAPVVADQTTQDRAMDFMEKVLPIDLSKYDINLKADATRNGLPPFFDDNRKITDMLYELSAENRKIDIVFRFENDVFVWCDLYPTEGSVFTSKQHSSLRDAALDFLKTYQTYTQIDSNNLIKMLDNVDLTKNYTATKENTKLTIEHYTWANVDTTRILWVHVIDGAEYDSFALTFDSETNLLLSVGDDRMLYRVGDSSVNISEEQAIDIAIENLKYYSYGMPDGSIVKDFKASKENAFATLVTSSVDYELRPYWDVRMILDDVYPGNVFAVSAFIWANNGEVLEYGNMATGGTSYIDNANGSNANPAQTSPSDSTLVIVLVVVVVLAVAASVIGLAIRKKHR